MEYPSFEKTDTLNNLSDQHSKLDQILELSKNLKKLHLLTTSNYDDFDHLIREYLKIGTEIFNMKIGIVSKIEGDNYTLCNAISPDNSLNKGDVFELASTYCYEVFKTQQVLGFPNVGEMKEFKDHPVYINMKLESYISAPIFVKEKLFGTLNFSSTQAKDHNFSENDKDFISIMANSIGNFLELKQKEDDLKESNHRMKELIGYVAHDLRTPLGNIQSMVQLLATDDVSPNEKTTFLEMIETTAQEALELVKTILEKAALGTGKIQLNLEINNLQEIILSDASHSKKLANTENKELVFELDNPIMVHIDSNRMNQVISNLISNAMKYSASNSEIKVQAKLKNGLVEFSVFNIKGSEEELTSQLSTGFGLEIVRDILKLHGTKLTLAETNKDYKVSFTLPISG
jgi:GAF domain-containing protein